MLGVPVLVTRRSPLVVVAKYTPVGLADGQRYETY